MEWGQGGPAGIEECPEIVASGAKGPGRLGVLPVAGKIALVLPQIPSALEKVATRNAGLRARRVQTILKHAVPEAGVSPARSTRAKCPVAMKSAPSWSARSMSRPNFKF